MELKETQRGTSTAIVMERLQQRNKKIDQNFSSGKKAHSNEVMAEIYRVRNDKEMVNKK